MEHFFTDSLALKRTKRYGFASHGKSDRETRRYADVPKFTCSCEASGLHSGKALKTVVVLLSQAVGNLPFFDDEP